jgi:hypothetical protein
MTLGVEVESTVLTVHLFCIILDSRVRRACHVDGMSNSAAARLFGIDRKTVAKILKHAVPPGYQRTAEPVRPMLDPFTGIIDQILEGDKRRNKKQRHTAALSNRLLDCSVQNTWTKSEHASFCISHLYVLNFFLALCRSQPHLPSTAVQSRVWLVISGANGHERAVRGSGQPDLS